MCGADPSLSQIILAPEGEQVPKAKEGETGIMEIAQ